MKTDTKATCIINSVDNNAIIKFSLVVKIQSNSTRLDIFLHYDNIVYCLLIFDNHQ